ncbi:hypothetical protein [Deinococcus kurensis]|uniref:hypothetical protein n=1 Tax=Deinococcus kurensis TaxID=2662757 RepID=UPI0012D367A7|nr:hypothetical protein [Deinococcus kurensis]
MTRINLLALGFLLGQAQAQQPLGYDPQLAVTVKTPAGKVVVVRGPQVPIQPDPDFTWRWSVQKVVKNRSGQFTAVLYSGAMSKYWDANVFLVRPDGRIDRLKNDTVRDVQWTEDGRYLIGMGVNTVRVWNLNGGLRQVSNRELMASSVDGQTLCLNVNRDAPPSPEMQPTSPVPPTPGLPVSNTPPNRFTEIRLSIPSLKQLSRRDREGQVTCKERS